MSLYTRSAPFTPGSFALGDSIKAEFDAVETAFGSVGEPLQKSGDTMTGKLGLLTDAKALESLEQPLVSNIGFLNEADHAMVGISAGGATPDAEDLTPIINCQANIRPNGTSVTGTSFLFSTKRHGSATDDDGDLPALCSLTGYAESVATATSLGGHHDIVGTTGYAVSRPGSTARAYGLWGVSTLLGTSGQGVGAEIDIKNNSGAAAPTELGAGSLTGVAITGQASGGASQYQTYGLLFQAQATAAFRVGISFDPNSILTHAIDMSRITSGLSLAVVLPNNSYLCGLDAAGANKRRLIGMSGTDATLIMNEANILFTNNSASTTYARITSSKNFGLGTADFGLGTGGIVAIANATAVPAINPAGGGLIYVESGALKYRGSSGTITTLGPA